MYLGPLQQPDFGSSAVNPYQSLIPGENGLSFLGRTATPSSNQLEPDRNTFLQCRNPSAGTQAINLNGQGPSLIVAGSSAKALGVQVGSTGTYISFQLQSSLPPAAAAANVAKATLRLFLGTGTSPTGTINIYPVTSAWTESTLNSSSQPTKMTPLASSIPLGGANSFLVVDVTQLVQAWLEGPSNGGLANYGIVIEAANSGTFAAFDSKENAVTSHEPHLEIVLVNSGPQGTAGPLGPIGLATTKSITYSQPKTPHGSNWLQFPQESRPH